MRFCRAFAHRPALRDKKAVIKRLLQVFGQGSGLDSWRFIKMHIQRAMPASYRPESLKLSNKRYPKRSSLAHHGLSDKTRSILVKSLFVMLFLY